jgi:hypothetical protein
LKEKKMKKVFKKNVMRGGKKKGGKQKRQGFVRIPPP